MAVNYTCEKCNKSMDETNFYTYKDGRKTELCKKCLTMHINNFNPDTYVWLLEKMDVPYVPNEWNILRDKAFAKNPSKMNGMSVFGKYLSKMKLKQWNQYGWADTEKLQAQAATLSAEKEAEMAEYEAELQSQYDKGEISEAEYKTLVSVKTQRDQFLSAPAPAPTGTDNPYMENNFMSEDDLPYTVDLTEEERVAFAIKWGRLYKPYEWVELERKYDAMMKSFDIRDADTTATLIHLCKTDLKMNQAIDCGDVEGYQKLSRVYDALRKSAKFTAAQNKEKEGDFVDSIGELIAMCEKDGFIPRFATDIPQDKVDQTLKDQKDYIYKLVTQDLGFGQQIEDALKKLDIQRQLEEEERIRAEQAGDDYDPYAPIELSDEDFVEDMDNVYDQLEADDLIYEEGDETE